MQFIECRFNDSCIWQDNRPGCLQPYIVLLLLIKHNNVRIYHFRFTAGLNEGHSYIYTHSYITHLDSSICHTLQLSQDMQFTLHIATQFTSYIAHTVNAYAYCINLVHIFIQPSYSQSYMCYVLSNNNLQVSLKYSKVWLRYEKAHIPNNILNHKPQAYSWGKGVRRKRLKLEEKI